MSVVDLDPNPVGFPLSFSDSDQHRGPANRDLKLNYTFFKKFQHVLWKILTILTPLTLTRMIKQSKLINWQFCEEKLNFLFFFSSVKFGIGSGSGSAQDVRSNIKKYTTCVLSVPNFFCIFCICV
jgi:hypothetical protein